MEGGAHKVGVDNVGWVTPPGVHDVPVGEEEARDCAGENTRGVDLLASEGNRDTVDVRGKEGKKGGGCESGVHDAPIGITK